MCSRWLGYLLTKPIRLSAATLSSAVAESSLPESRSRMARSMWTYTSLRSASSVASAWILLSTASSGEAGSR